jgi:hypothetical protein
MSGMSAGRVSRLAMERLPNVKQSGPVRSTESGSG